MRELFIRKPELYSKDEWLGIASSTVHTRAIIPSIDVYEFDKDVERVILKQSFRNYIDNPDHWVIGHLCGHLIPDLQGRVPMD